MKRILAAILASILLLGTVACGSNKDVPDGYMLVSLEDELFDLYVPKSWQSNTESGISGGYSSLTSGVMASASTMRGSSDIGLSDYVDAVIESYGTTLTDFEQLTEPKETTLGSYAAFQFDYKMKSNDRILKFRCTVAKNKDAFVILSCCAPEDAFDANESVFNEIASYFSFRDFEERETEEPFILVDENTPEGFYLASKSMYEFRFYVPNTWTVDTTGNIPGARYSATDFSNVSLTSFTVQQGISNGQEYWESFKLNYLYEMTEVSVDESAKMGGYDAYGVEYVSNISGINFYIKQVFLTTPSIIYIFTYTSDASHYEKHLDDVDTMLSMFEFKK